MRCFEAIVLSFSRFLRKKNIYSGIQLVDFWITIFCSDHKSSGSIFIRSINICSIFNQLLNTFHRTWREGIRLKEHITLLSSNERAWSVEVFFSWFMNQLLSFKMFSWVSHQSTIFLTKYYCIQCTLEFERNLFVYLHSTGFALNIFIFIEKFWIISGVYYF